MSLSRSFEIDPCVSGLKDIMTTVPLTNTVKPDITSADDIWFDPRAGLDDPSLIKGPYEGAANKQEVKLSLV